MLRADDLHLTYHATVALAGASATVAAGEVVALTGPSGSGKSSMLYCMAGLIRPDSGEIHHHAMRLTGATDNELTDLRRRRFGFVFQFAELIPELTLRENISMPMELNGIRRGERRRRISEIVDRLGIAEHADRRPAQVSGGQAQRAAVARAVVHRPEVLFADEPTGSLDSDSGQVVLKSLLGLASEFGTAVLLVTHDREIARQADRTIKIANGRTGPA